MKNPLIIKSLKKERINIVVLQEDKTVNFLFFFVSKNCKLVCSYCSKFGPGEFNLEQNIFIIPGKDLLKLYRFDYLKYL